MAYLKSSSKSDYLGLDIERLGIFRLKICSSSSLAEAEQLTSSLEDVGRLFSSQLMTSELLRLNLTKLELPKSFASSSSSSSSSSFQPDASH